MRVVASEERSAYAEAVARLVNAAPELTPSQSYDLRRVLQGGRARQDFPAPVTAS